MESNSGIYVDGRLKGTDPEPEGYPLMPAGARPNQYGLAVLAVGESAVVPFEGLEPCRLRWRLDSHIRMLRRYSACDYAIRPGHGGLRVTRTA